MTSDFVKNLVKNTLLKKAGDPDATIKSLQSQAKMPKFIEQEVQLTLGKLTNVKSTPRTEFPDQKTVMYKTSATDVGIP
jgi:hypothetical protein